MTVDQIYTQLLKLKKELHDIYLEFTLEIEE